MTIDVVELVPRDIVFLRGGNIVPADCKWLEGDVFQVGHPNPNPADCKWLEH
jgi:magnesium-transporting ATPase (P-type)